MDQPLSKSSSTASSLGLQRAVDGGSRTPRGDREAREVWEGAGRAAPHLLGGHHAASPLLEPPSPITELLRAGPSTTPTAQPAATSTQDISAPGDSVRISRAGAPSGGDGGGGSQSPPASEGLWGTPGPRSPLRAQGPATQLCGGKSGPDCRAVALSRAPEPVHGRMTRRRRESRGWPAGSVKWDASIY